MSSRPLPPDPRAATAPNLPQGARRSHALESLSHYLRAHEALHVLDFGGINQANLDFITGLGHRLYSEDLIRACDAFFTPEEIAARSFSEERIELFLDQTFDFPDQSCDACLVWDTLQFLPPALAQAVLKRIHRVLAPDSLLLAFFHPEAGSIVAAPHTCRILDDRQLRFTPRPAPRPIQTFNTRSIERFFQRFSNVKFFLTRENLQEVIARR